MGASPGDGGALGPQTKIKVTDRRAGSRVEPEAGRAARMRATRPRQTLGTRTELPELQRAGKPGLAMPRGRQAGARQRTPQAPAGLGRGRLGAAAHRSRSRRRRQGRKTGRKGTEARLEASAPSAPARKSRGHGSEGGSFGSRNRPRDWTYSEEQQQGQKHCSARLGHPPKSSRSDAASCPGRCRPEEPARPPALRSASSALSSFSQPPRRCSNHCLGKWLFYEWEGMTLQCARAPSAIL